MPQPDSQSSSIPPLPPGYTLQTQDSIPPLPPGYALESGPSQSAQPSAGEQFKQQAWSQAGQNLRQGQFLNAAKNIGSLFTSQNPAAVSALDQTSSALHSVL